MRDTRLRLRHILCPTDFSEFSFRALLQAAGLAQRFEARLKLIHVLPNQFSVSGGPYLPPSNEMYEQAARELQSFAEPAIQAGLSVSTELRDGDPWREIQWAAVDSTADLLVMGTHGRSGFEHLLLGSVTEKVLRCSPCPVLTVCRERLTKDEEPGVFRRILCACDLSESSRHALAFALSLAAEHQAQLTLLHVLEGLHPYREMRELDPLHRQLEEAAHARLEASVCGAARDWCTIQRHVTVGRAHREIVNAAAEQKVDLIVMGTHGQGSIERMFFGSTSHHVVREASCPVLTVRPLQLRSQVGTLATKAVMAFQP